MRTVLGILISTVCLLGLAQAGMDHPAEVALDLYTPVVCFQGDRPVSGGTGFPLDKTHLMTAGHVSCEEGESMRVKAQSGWVPADSSLPSSDMDAQIVSVTKGQFEKKAEFRDEVVLGERATGYGIALGGILTRGEIMAIHDDLLLTSNPPIGGQSGSALVGDDGKVLGMTIQARPGITGDYPTFFVDGAIPSKLLSSFWKEFKSRNGIK